MIIILISNKGNNSNKKQIQNWIQMQLKRNTAMTINISICSSRDAMVKDVEETKGCKVFF